MSYCQCENPVVFEANFNFPGKTYHAKMCAGCHNDVREQAPATSSERVSISREDLDLARQWFNAAVDTNPEYLTDDDFRSAERIEQALEKSNE